MRGLLTVNQAGRALHVQMYLFVYDAKFTPGNAAEKKTLRKVVLTLKCSHFYCV